MSRNFGVNMCIHISAFQILFQHVDKVGLKISMMWGILAHCLVYESDYQNVDQQIFKLGQLRRVVIGSAEKG